MGKEIQIANELETAINSNGWSAQKFAEAVRLWHTTLQQEFFRTIRTTIQEFAKDGYYDQRNEASHQMAVKIVESGSLNGGLPRI